MTANEYTAVFRHVGLYMIAAGDAPDMHDGPFKHKLDAMLAAREQQTKRKRDPNFVVDLTNADPAELGEFLR